MLTQPFFMRKAQTFSSPGFVITQSFRIFRHKVFRYGKVTFLFYLPSIISWIRSLSSI